MKNGEKDPIKVMCTPTERVSSIQKQPKKGAVKVVFITLMCIHICINKMCIEKSFCHIMIYESSWQVNV